ncbi:MAG: hypothetical protein JNM28_07220 [Armatimonadetes bacterium]|nr:hypothetical protein [Armatimonadota bacterium]
METVRAAAVSWAIQECASPDAFLGHAADLVGRAARLGAELVVLPESIDLERISYHGPIPQEDVAATLASEFPQVRAHCESLARDYGITLVAGSHLHEVEGQYFNSALVCTPDSSFLQPKNVLTQWELEEWRISEGQGLKLAEDQRLGTLVCYDSEFPGSARALCEAGAKILAVPAYNEFPRGFHRVRWSCHARSVECQVFVIHSALVGSLGREPVSRTYGSSAILCPPVEPFREDGILAQTPFNEESIAVADLPIGLIEEARDRDDVRNWHDRDKGNWQILT